MIIIIITIIPVITTMIVIVASMTIISWLEQDAPKEAKKWKMQDHCWVAVKELKLSYYIGETLLFTIYTHYGNLI